MGGRGDHAREPHQRVRPDRWVGVDASLQHQAREPSAERRAEEHRGREDAARATRSDGCSGRDRLGQEEREEHPAHYPAIEHLADHLGAVSGNLGKEHRDEPHDGASQRGAERPSTRHELAEPRLAAREEHHEHHPGHATQRTEHHGACELDRRDQLVRSKAVERSVAEGEAREQGRERGRCQHRHQELDGERAREHLDDEQRGGDRGVVRGRETCGGTCGEEHPPLRVIHAEHPSDAAGERCADLNEWTFSPQRASAHDREERREGLGQRGPQRHPPASQGQRLHDVRDAVALGQSGGGDRSDETTEERTDRRRERACPEGKPAKRLEHVAAAEEPGQGPVDRAAHRHGERRGQGAPQHHGEHEARRRNRCARGHARRIGDLRRQVAHSRGL